MRRCKETEEQEVKGQKGWQPNSEAEQAELAHPHGDTRRKQSNSWCYFSTEPHRPAGSLAMGLFLPLSWHHVSCCETQCHLFSSFSSIIPLDMWRVNSMSPTLPRNSWVAKMWNNQTNRKARWFSLRMSSHFKTCTRSNYIYMQRFWKPTWIIFLDSSLCYSNHRCPLRCPGNVYCTFPLNPPKWPSWSLLLKVFY